MFNLSEFSVSFWYQSKSLPQVSPIKFNKIFSPRSSIYFWSHVTAQQHNKGLLVNDVLVATFNFVGQNYILFKVIKNTAFRSFIQFKAKCKMWKGSVHLVHTENFGKKVAFLTSLCTCGQEMLVLRNILHMCYMDDINTQKLQM